MDGQENLMVKLATALDEAQKGQGFADVNLSSEELRALIRSQSGGANRLSEREQDRKSKSPFPHLAIQLLTGHG